MNPKWEYKVLFTTLLPDPNDQTILDCTADMNQLGEEGWEAFYIEALPDIITGNVSANKAVYLKRLKADKDS
tara:strand:+ start:242 stop:457 length:216 start_codon:yes stop_codon:yes gene_type:complete